MSELWGGVGAAQGRPAALPALLAAAQEKGAGGEAEEEGMSDERTVTETLVKAMEEAGEAKHCLVIMTTEDGHILSLGTTSQRVVRLGLLEAAKQWMIVDMLAETDE